jgi:diadenosine tetraphosphate (Ap4A) HIT family hydrolase
MGEGPEVRLSVPVDGGEPRPDPVCITCTPVEHEQDVVAFSEHWKVILHPDQTVPGACLIGARRHVPKLGELTAPEQAEFFPLFGRLESSLEQQLGASMVTAECLRNWAFRADAPDPPFLDGRPNPHVHWHVAPRYEHAVEVAGERFDDPTFGEPLVWTRRRAEAGTRRAVIVALRLGLGV